MKVYPLQNIKPDTFSGTVCAIGNFDGVHLGHQKILQELEKAKNEFCLPSMVYTFEPHPVRILNPKKDLKLIFSSEQRIRLLERFNPDGLVISTFTTEVAKTKAVDFVKDILVDLLHVKKVIVGYDFNFGKGGDGNAAHLTKLGKGMGFEVTQVQAVNHGGRAISSSRIRRLVQAGEMKMVHEMLGRPFFVVGKVVKGYQRGQNVLGIPTANLSTQQEIIPAKGVYAALIRIPQGTFGGAVNVGVNPTFDSNGLSIEAHIFDFNGNLYDNEMEIHFLRRLRDEKKFDSIDRLRDQMHSDIAAAKEFTKDINPEILSR